jgi:DNA-binding GntR family transcriptional regulator
MMASRDIQTVDQVYKILEKRIIEGQYPPNSALSQLRIAEELGISRTPLREAFRMLERHGLVVSEHNKRFRVAGFSAGDLDELYALRITVEGLAARAGIPVLSNEDLDKLQLQLVEMDQAMAARDYDGWNEPHITFHHTLISRAGDRSVNLARQLSQHAERYRYASMLPIQPGSWEQARVEHAALFAAAEERDGELVANLLAAHYGRVALSVLSLSAPMHEPHQIRHAMTACGAHPFVSSSL